MKKREKVKRDKIQEFLIRVGSTTFLGEHGMVHTATLEMLTDKFEELVKEIYD